MCIVDKIRTKLDHIEEFKNLIRAHTFRLLHKNETNDLTGFASCFIWQERADRMPVIITAGHNLELSGALLETVYKDEDGHPLLLDAETFEIFYSDDIDFAFSTLPGKVIKFLQESPQIHIPCFKERISKPNHDKDYGFSKANNYEFAKSGELLLLPQNECSEVGMKFVLEDRGFYYFKTLENLREDEYYSGASGSPIADREGKIVSVLTG